MGILGVPELFAVLLLLVLWAIPIYAAVWLLRKIAKMVRIQEEMRDRLKSIERKLDAKA